MLPSKDGVRDLISKLEAIDAAAPDGGSAPPKPPLNNGREGDRFPDMEARLAKLESDMEYVKRDVTEMRPDVSKLKTDMAMLVERVSHLPGKGFVVTAAITTIGGVVALIGLLQHLGLLH